MLAERSVLKLSITINKLIRKPKGRPSSFDKFPNAQTDHGAQSTLPMAAA